MTKENINNFKYRLNSYNNFHEHRGYYVLTLGKYKIVHATISFVSMIKFIKNNKIDFREVHLNNITLDDLSNYCNLDDRFDRV